MISLAFLIRSTITCIIKSKTKNIPHVITLCLGSSNPLVQWSIEGFDATFHLFKSLCRESDRSRCLEKPLSKPSNASANGIYVSSSVYVCHTVLLAISLSVPCVKPSNNQIKVQGIYVFFSYVFWMKYVSEKSSPPKAKAWLPRNANEF